MKVLKDNYNQVAAHTTEIEEKPKKITCEKCLSELEYEKSDTHIGVWGCAHVTCPLCSNEIMLEDDEFNIELTKDNIEFPKHFWHTSKETGAVDIRNNEIENYIRKGIDYLRKHNNDDDFNYYTTQTGNMFVDVFGYSGDEVYQVIVSKDYYEVEIPFEAIDYR